MSCPYWTLFKKKRDKTKGKEKYSEIKKLNVHTAASYVIGRRALSFVDNRPV